MKIRIAFFLTACLFLTLCRHNPVNVIANKLDYKPKILLVTAHPDDETVFSATIFKTTHLLNGIVDLAVITNGEGGYRYSTLAGYIYGLELDREEIGRQHLPEIRKNELYEAGKILGLNEYFFFDETDDEFSLDIEIPLALWDKKKIVDGLKEIILSGSYDFIFTMLPVEGTHSHHKAATLLALEALNELEPYQRPMILGQGNTAFTGLDGYPLTNIRGGVEPFIFDRTKPFGYDNRLNYRIIPKWVIAAHKSQGAFQMATVGDSETFLYYEINDETLLQKTLEYFKAVAEAQIYNP